MAPRCPICGRAADEAGAAFPFCSERCRLLDLGAWLDERYVIGASDEEDASGVDRHGEREDERDGDGDRKGG